MTATMSRDPNPIRKTEASHEPSRLSITVLLYETSHRLWVAQGLQKNMVAHGPTPEAALAAIKQVLQIRVNFDALHNRQPLARLRKAADVYWKASERAEVFQQETLDDSFLPAHLVALLSKERPCV